MAAPAPVLPEMEPIPPCKVGVLAGGIALHCCVLLAMQPVCLSSVQAGAGTCGPKEHRGSLWFRARKQMDLWLQPIDSELKCYLASGGELPPPALLCAAASAHHEQQFKAGCGRGFFFFSFLFFFFFLMGTFFFPLQTKILSKENKPLWPGAGLGDVLLWMRGGSSCVGAAPAG